MTPEEFTLLFSEPTPRRVFCAVDLGGATPTEILAASGLEASKAAPAIGKLLRTGLLRSDGPGRLAVNEETLAAVAAAATLRQEEQAVAEQPDPQLRGLVRGGVLVHLPEEEDADARRTVLRHVAETAFVPGDEYDERHVTDRLRPWCAGGAVDAVHLRRLLVDGGVLRRDSGRYALVTPDGSVPGPDSSDQGSVGIGMSGAGTFVVSTQPDTGVQFEITPTYWLAFGSYEAGTVVSEDILTRPYQLQFPDGATKAVATFDGKNWTVEYGG
ncbi:DUF2087 domain-containing protein [Micromonospora sp. NBC_01405]|uniref:DUF2087 domain-containing protein n=1 Tax=Micromonospora sp. NBC_01405 TaxID=2903589 RepID=UPI00324A9F23